MPSDRPLPKHLDKDPSIFETTLKMLNIDEPMAISPAKCRELEEPAAVVFEVVNIDNCLAERHPKIALNVVEARVALAMCFLEFREVNDRL